MAGASAWWAQRRARAATGRRRGLLRLGAVLLMAGPLMAVLVVSGSVRNHWTPCGSVIEAARHSDAGCREKGERLLRLTVAWGSATTAGAVVSLAGAALAGRRREPIG